MSKELVCPFCNGELVGTVGHPICRNRDCVMCDDPMPQDLLEELIRTRKALDVALCSLQDIAESNGDFITGASTPLDEHEYAAMMLDKIKFITKGGNNE